MGQRVVINWNISSVTGWGVYGFNLALNWAGNPGIDAATSLPLVPEYIVADPLRLRTLQPFFARSAGLQSDLKAFANRRFKGPAAVLTPLSASGQPVAAAHNVILEGEPTFGVIFCEEAIAPAAVEAFKRLPLIVAGSSWNEQLLRAYGIDRVRTVLQGIDPTMFHPAPKIGLMRDRFLIFSGGKAELRKGQDIVLAAFKVFAERHPEAMLVTAWHSPWPETARSLDRTGLVAPMAFNAAGQIDVPGWAARNNIRPDQVLDLGLIPNTFMPQILREMNAAVFANRSEGGTNLVAMECMACGLPVVLSRNTGHVDLIEGDNCYPLLDQQPERAIWRGIEGVPGWGESRVDEVVAELERIFSDREEARQRGARAAQTMTRLTWGETARQMARIVAETPKS